MLSYQMHLFVHSLYSDHIRLCVVSKLDLMSAADTLCSPVEVTHIYRASYFACNCMESGLPPLDRFSRAFRCKGKMYYLAAFHLPDDAQGYIASFFSVHGDSSKLP